MFICSKIFPNELRVLFVGDVSVIVSVQILKKLHDLFLLWFEVNISESCFEQHQEVVHSKYSFFKFHKSLT